MQNQFVHQTAFSQIGILRKQILAAQLAGVLLSVIPSLLIDSRAHSYAWLAFAIGGITALYFLAVYRDWLMRLERVLTFGERLQRYRSHLGWLIALDALLCLGLIGLSGGFPTSHLSFVFLLIPCTVGFVRSGGTTLRNTVIGVVIIVLTEAFFGLPSSWIASVLQLFGFQQIVASQSSLYPFVVAIGIIIGVLLAWYQSFVAAGSSIPDRIVEWIRNMLTRAAIDPAELDALTRAVSKGFHRMSRIVSLTNEPEIHCSSVHPLEDAVSEAFILALPGSGLTKDAGRLMQTAAEVTFAAHWLDDAFDALGYDRLIYRAGSARIDLSSIEIPGIADYYHPYGIQRVMREIRKITRWQHGCDVGIMRIILGGFVQSRVEPEATVAAERIRGFLIKSITIRHVADLLAAANRAFVWGIAKSDMPLVLSIYWDGMTLCPLSVILDALFMPLLVWHNLEDELLREKLPRLGFEGRGIESELEEAVGVATQCIGFSAQFGHSVPGPTVFAALRPVLDLAHKLYGPRMPKTKPYVAYNLAVKNWLAEWK